MKGRKGSGTGRRGMPAAERLERIEKEAAGSALEELVREHLAAVMDARDRFPLSTQDLLSARVPSQDIPADIKRAIGALHVRMRSVIEEVARRLEDRRYRSAESSVAEMNLSLKERERVRTLVNSDKQVNVSCQTLKIAVEMFSQLNEMLIAELEAGERQGGVQVQRNAILGNALVVYELTDFVIRILETFEARGFAEIRKLREEMRKQSDELRGELDALRAQAQGDEIDPDVREKILGNIEERRGSIDVLDDEWDRYVESLRTTLGDLQAIHRKLPTLRLIRDNARGQINLLEAVAVASLVKNSLGTMAGTIVTLKNLELAGLTPDRVRRLMGLGSASA